MRLAPLSPRFRLGMLLTSAWRCWLPAPRAGPRRAGPTGPRGSELRQRSLPEPPVRPGGRGVREVPQVGQTRLRGRCRRRLVRPGQRPALPRANTRKPARRSRSSSGSPRTTPPRRPAVYRIGETAYVVGDLPAARKYLEAYVGSNPSDRRYLQAAWSHLGDVDFRLNDLPAAQKAYENSLAGNPQGSLASRAKLGLGRVLAAQERDRAGLAGPPRPRLDRRRRVVRQGLARSRLDRVGPRPLGRVRPRPSESLEKATPRSPLVAEARIERAEALGHLNKPEEAEALLRSVADDPDPAPRRSRRPTRSGASLLARGKAAEALDRARPGRRQARRVPARLDPPIPRRRGRPGARPARRRPGPVPQARRGRPQRPLGRRRPAPGRRLDPRRQGPGDRPQARRARSPQKFPDSPLRADARLLDARAALALGQPKEAIAALSRARRRQARPRPSPRPLTITWAWPIRRTASPRRPPRSSPSWPRPPQPSRATPSTSSARPTSTPAGSSRRSPRSKSTCKTNPKGRSPTTPSPGSPRPRPRSATSTRRRAALARLAEGFPRSPTLPPTRLRLAEAALARQAIRSGRRAVPARGRGRRPRAERPEPDPAWAGRCSGAATPPRPPPPSAP